MEYVIGSIQRGNLSHLILKTKGVEHTDLSGRLSLEQRRGNVIIKDTFTIINKYHSEDGADGLAYDFYYIKDHFKEEDRSEEVRAGLEQQITDLEIDIIEQDQAITDHDIELMELHDTIDGLVG